MFSTSKGENYYFFLTKRLTYHINSVFSEPIIFLRPHNFLFVIIQNLSFQHHTCYRKNIIKVNGEFPCSGKIRENGIFLAKMQNLSFLENKKNI